MEEDIHPDKYFYARDGTVIKNINHLFEELQHMPDEVFEYHVNDEKNDLYHWIKDVFGEYKLAQNVKDARSREEVIKHVFVSLFR